MKINPPYKNLNKKTLLFVFSIFFSFSAFSQLTMTWGPITAGQTITIPTQGTAYTVDWGYLVAGSPVTSVHTGPATHTFPTPLVGGPDFTISITGSVTRIEFNNSGDRALIKEVTSWGTNTFTSMQNAFYGCTNLTTVPSAAPVFSAGFNSMASVFRNCPAFTGDVSGWDVSTVTSMRDAFRGASSFDGDISGWTVTSVQNMADMFRDATSFNQDISGWTTSSLAVMARIFRDATSFNQDISGWNTSGVTNMNSVFNGASAFDHDLGGLDLSNTPSMNAFLNNAGLSVANYDATLNGWNAQSVSPINVGTNGMVYCNDGNTSRLALEAAGWSFNTHTACATLPIELISFKAMKTEQNTIALFWVTAMEINNDFFTIERSTNAKEWNAITKINGAGNSNEILSYQTSDLSPLNGIAYYRLKQTDFDSKFTYSKIIAINVLSSEVQNNISIYPNPTKNIITVDANKETLFSTRVYNILGKQVKVNILSSSESKNVLDLSDLTDGVYFIKGNGVNVKFFKKNR